MIAIKKTAAPAFLSDKTKKWHKETLAAINHYTTGKAGVFNYKTYNDPVLKAELKKIFPKCAYCESPYAAVSDGDVEHFRPKGQVSEKNPKSPGYYWLANDWDNLLISCQHCNQRRLHELFGATKLESYGKLDQFPLSNETKRVTKEGKSLSEEEKVRLLLNPCKDKPETHFEYDITEGVIQPKTAKGTASIKVYVLQRVQLVKERKMCLTLLLTQMDRVKRELARYNNEKTANQKTIFDAELEFLMDFTKSEKPYAGMCRYFVKKFLKDNGLA